MSSYYEKFPDGRVVCIDEEIPFEVPQGWEWCRLSNVISLLSGQDLTPDRYFDTETGIPYITGASYFVDGSIVISRWTKTPTSISKKGDLLITCKGTVGTMAYNTIGDVHIARQIMAITPICVCLKYLQIFLTFIVPELEKQAHSIIPGISRDILLNTIVSLPPLQEQIRISETVDKITPYLEKYAKTQYSLDALNSNIKVSLKRSILQEAIQGKLVPQIASEGDASVLLQQIEMEKQRLVKEGKLKKKDLVSSTIYRGDDNKYYEKTGKDIEDITEEIPFEIPKNWCWVRHNSLFDISGGSQPPKSYFRETPQQGHVRLYQIRDYGSSPQPIYIPTSFATKKTVKGDILLARYGASLGKVFIAEDGAYNVAMAKVVPLFMGEYVSKDYLLLYYKSELYQHIIKDRSRCAQAGFNKEDLKSLLFPLPPIDEQHRICKAYDSIIASIMSR